MKKIINKIGLILPILILLVFNAKAQLPLMQGDAVVTHSQNNGGTGGSLVVRVIKTSNTTTAPLGSNWNTATMTTPCPGPGVKPNNWYPTSPSYWTQGTLGNVFGITLDNQPAPNIYVSSTQIYSGSNQNASKVWRLNGSTGANTLVFNFANTTRSLGNLKYLQTPTAENIYVSNWDNGNIERLTGISAGVLPWSHQTPFNPKFGLPADNPKYLPYGLAVRNMGANNYRLYYAKISLSSPFSTNEIWSVNLNPSGNFLPSSEQKEIFPTAALTSYINTVISDIAFSEDGKKMLVGQQTFNSFGSLCAHRSNVAEFITQAIDHNWNASPNLFHAGAGSGFSSSCGGAGGDWNSVGGVTYSNNILKGAQSSLKCESTVWFTSDAIVFGPCFAYGIQGMNANGGALNAVGNSVIVDEDDYTVSLDKMQLGDVEVYKKPLNCNPCSCGSWQGGPVLNTQEIPWQYLIDYTPDVLQKRAPENKGPISAKLMVDGNLIESRIDALPTIGLGLALPKVYPIQFVQGNVSGVINATYLCTGNCGATYSWDITDNATTTVVASGTTLPIDLAQYNSALKCGKYTLTIKAKCGTSDCGSLVIPITIICEPPSCCKDQITITKTGSELVAVPNIPTPAQPYSYGGLTFTINTTAAMSEVRVSVEDFNLSAGSPNCLVCNSRSVNWGNILSATLNSVIPGTLTINPGDPGSGSIPADYREIVFNTGSPISLNPGSLNIILSLPEVTGLECCTIKVHLCLKFTFKNTQCVECVKMVCGDFELVTKKGGPVLNTNDAQFRNFDVNH
jgi:hypothetical protein